MGEEWNEECEEINKKIVKVDEKINSLIEFKEKIEKVMKEHKGIKAYEEIMQMKTYQEMMKDIEETMRENKKSKYALIKERKSCEIKKIS